MGASRWRTRRPKRDRLSQALAGSLAACVLAGAVQIAPPLHELPNASSATPCANPADCRLWEAAAGAGVRFGLATPHPDDAVESALLVSEANVTVNHELSWSGIEPDRGVWDFTKADKTYNFALAHGHYQIGMHFAWDQELLDDMPAWVAAITDPDELRSVLRTRAHTIFARYPKLDRIDVINEALVTVGDQLYHNHFYNVLGPDYISQLFEIVESEAPPSTQLIVNEGGIDYLPTKAQALVQIVADLKSRGRRVDAVGLQTHLSFGEPNWQTIYDTMRQLDQLGVHPFISEVDVPIPATIANRSSVQAERYRRVVSLCLSVPSCDTVNVWGVSDADTWYDWGLYPDLDPLLFDESYKPKPAYDAVRSAFSEGRSDPSVPPRFLTTTTTPIASGQASIPYSLECTPSGPVTEYGYPDLAAVTDRFFSGNPIRSPLPVDLRWTSVAGPDGTITYDAGIEVDFPELARVYREETARPAIGLGGHHDLVDTAWLRLAASTLQVTLPAPAGTAVIGDPTASGTSTPLVASRDPGSVALTMTNVVGDSRADEPPVSMHATWSVRADPSVANTMVTMPPPMVSFDLEVRFGVVYSGLDVYGGVTAPVSCHPVGQVAVATTAVGALDAATTTSGAPQPAGPAGTSAVVATPRFTA